MSPPCSHLHDLKEESAYFSRTKPNQTQIASFLTLAALMITLWAKRGSFSVTHYFQRFIARFHKPSHPMARAKAFKETHANNPLIETICLICYIAFI